jgi:hypothetical protein
MKRYLHQVGGTVMSIARGITDIEAAVGIDMRDLIATESVRGIIGDEALAIVLVEAEAEGELSLNMGALQAK